jgi:hypothetical protein
MGFWKNCYNDIDASNPTERVFSFLIGIILMGLMVFATLNLIGGGLLILGIITGVIK